MRVKTALLAAIAVLCLPTPLWAQCVQVQTSTVPYTISQSKSAAEIHGASDIPGWVEPNAGKALGNFSSKLDIRYETGDEFVSYSPCGPFSRFHVHLSFAQATINIGREVDAQSCMYNAAISHEQQHYNAYKQALTAAGYPLQTAIAAYLQQLPPSTAESAANDRYNAQVGINGIVEQHMSELMRELARRNTEIDTPAESMRVYAQCPEQMNQIRRRTGN